MVLMFLMTDSRRHHGTSVSFRIAASLVSSISAYRPMFYSSTMSCGRDFSYFHALAGLNAALRSAISMSPLRAGVA